MMPYHRVRPSLQLTRQADFWYPTGPVTRLVPHPAGMPSQHRVLVPEDQQLSIPRLIPAEHQHSQAE
jgi:hypothetical protein